jgi:quinol monooxygenase YgiN
MGQLIVEVKFTDNAKFEANFAKGATFRQQAGVTNSRVFRDAADPNHVVVISDATDEVKARALFANPEVRKMMQEAGSAAPPKVSFAK